MTAPERIWAASVTENYGEWQTTIDGLPRPTEYVRADLYAALEAQLAALSPAPEAQQEPVAYLVNAPEDEYYGIGPDRLQFHPLAQYDLDNGYRQTPPLHPPLRTGGDGGGT